MIDAKDKYCDECGSKVKIDKTESNRIYDTHVRGVRDLEYTQFYHSKQWRQIVEIVKSKYNYVDVYSLYVLHRVERGDICHHVRELKVDGWSDRLNPNMIVYLTHNNHSNIHALLDKDYEGTIKMLEGLINRYIEDYIL